MVVGNTVLVALFSLCLAGAVPAASVLPRERSLDTDWQFVRRDAPGAEKPEFDDGDWRTVNLPHDWSIEDLAPTGRQTSAISVVEGKWRFHSGDDPSWKTPGFKDGDWEEVVLPDTWNRHSKDTAENSYGWFRRHLMLDREADGKPVDLLLGKISEVDETYVNGHRVGGMGSFPPRFQTADDQERYYHVPAGIIHGDGTDVVAVRVFSAKASGGLYAASLPVAHIGPFDPAASEGGASTGHVLGGTGWYRHHFRLPPSDTGKAVSIRFDGVYMDSDVWLNGHSLGNHPYGYTPFSYDLTPWLKAAGEENVISVRVRNEGKNSRWYSGSGIYRHVWLTVTDPLHIGLWGIAVTTPQVSKEAASVNVAVALENGRASEAVVLVRTRLLAPNGKTVASAESPARVPAGGSNLLAQTLVLAAPKLWNCSTPNLYRAEVEVVADKKLVDQVETTFGVRRLEMDVEHGFRLNGEVVKLKGGCVHHDNGPLGSAAIDRAEERRVELLKANGFNAIRTSHNPPSPAFLDACDRLGMLVIDEAFDQWEAAKNPQDYHRFFKDWGDADLGTMVRRDRNHPSVILWSIGNEIHERFSRPDLAEHLRQVVRSLDTSRPVTAAICHAWDWPGQVWEQASDPAFENLDVGGYNYLPEKYESDHARQPKRIMVCTESYPGDAFNCWTKVETHPYVIGDFVWTAFDYLGESGIGHSVLDNEKNGQLMPWPWFNAFCGDLDLCGFKKPQSYYRDVVWSRSQIEMAVHVPLPPGRSEKVSAWGWTDELPTWSWPVEKGHLMKVAVYSRCEKVRLELNGKKVEEKVPSAGSRLTARFEVPYASGVLRAVGLVDGKEVTSIAFRSAGPPKKLRLTADRADLRADRNDLAYLTVEVIDAAGERVPTEMVSVRFKVSGEGDLAATGSGNPCDPASFRRPERKTFQGRCLAILQPNGVPGKITLRAEADELAPATVVVRTR